MNIILLGTGVAIPQLEKAQSGILVNTPEELVLFDCGAGILGRIVQSGYDFLKIRTLFFTHHHLDHNADFLALLKAQKLVHEDLDTPMPLVTVYGPVGTEDRITRLFALYEYLSLQIKVVELIDGSVTRVGSAVVTARATKHSMPSLAYRLQTPTSVLVYSGDTEPTDAIRDLCRGHVDVLIHECSFPDSFAPVTNHTTPARLRDLVADLNVDRIVLTHLYPHAAGFESEMIETINQKFAGRVDVGYDLMKIFL